MFSDTKEIYVDSVVYNLSGSNKKTKDYLKSAVLGAVFSPSAVSVAEALQANLLHGPVFNLKSFARWARSSGYTAALGQTTGQIRLPVALNYTALASAIPHPPGSAVEIQEATIAEANYLRWAQRYMVENHPDEVGTSYTVDFDAVSNIVNITRVGGQTASLTATDFDLDGRYLYALYVTRSPGSSEPLVPGDVQILSSGDPPPSTDGWTAISYSSSPGTLTLNTAVIVVESFSDNRPDITTATTTPQTISTTRVSESYERSIYLGLVEQQLHSQREVMTLTQTPEIAVTTTKTTSSSTISGGIVKTTTTTTITESLVTARTKKIDTQLIIHESISPSQMLIYRQYSGIPAYDALFASTTNVGDFYPFIPIRLWNNFLTESLDSSLYARVNKATKKSLGTTLPQIIDGLSSTPALSDIDFAYVVFGVSLNTKDNAAKRYIYEFFQEMMLGQDLTSSAYNNWRDQLIEAQAVAATWLAWAENGSYRIGASEYSYGDIEPEPPRPVFPVIPDYATRIWANALNYGMEIHWMGVTETYGTGLKKPGAKAGDIWFEAGTPETFIDSLWYSAEGGVLRWDTGSRVVDRTYLHWQVSANEWRSLEIRGLTHYNWVYGGQFVVTKANDAITMTNEAPFIIPLHEELLKRMPIRLASEFGSAAAYMVLNCYKEVTQRWYESLGFRVVLLVVLFVAAAEFGLLEFATSGILGTHAKVGAALGFAGANAVLVGAITNFLAATLLSTLIQAGSVAVFGKKVGTIVGIVASFLAITIGTELMATSSNIFNALTDAKNLLKLTIAAGGGYADLMQSEAMSYVRRTEEVMREYQTKSKEIAEKTEAEFGTGELLFNPLELTSLSTVGVFEPPETFLSRTLMTGSDIAEITLSFPSRFAELTLSTQLPI